MDGWEMRVTNVLQELRSFIPLVYYPKISRPLRRWRLQSARPVVSLFCPQSVAWRQPNQTHCHRWLTRESSRFTTTVRVLNRPRSTLTVAPFPFDGNFED